MNAVPAILNEIESAGVAVRLDGDKVRISYCDAEQRQQLSEQISFLRSRRREVVEWLKERTTIPTPPPGVRLVSWDLKKPPVAIDTCSVVTDPDRFARTTLDQLQIALSTQGRWVGWTIHQLLDRLQQVGVAVELNGVE